MDSFFSLSPEQKILVFAMTVVLGGLIIGGISFLIVLIIKTSSKYKTRIGLGKSGISVDGGIQGSSSPLSKDPYFLEVLTKKDKQISGLYVDIDIIKNKMLAMELDVIKRSYETDELKVKRPLKEHPLIANLQNIINNGPEISDSDIRNKSNLQIKFDIFKAVMIFRNKVMLDLVLEVLNELEKPNLQDIDKDEILSKIPTIYQDWNAKTIDDISSLPIKLTNGSILNGAPQCFMKKFNIWDDTHSKAFFIKMKDVMTSEFYKTWKIKFILIMDVLDVLSQHSSMEAKHTLSVLNGELDTELKKSLGDKYK